MSRDVLIFFFLLLLGIPCMALWDIYSTARWETQPSSSVNLYTLILALVWSLILLIVVSIHFDERIRKRREYLTSLVNKATDLIRQGKREEAAVILNHYKSVLLDDRK